MDYQTGILFALIGALFAAVTNILVKKGMQHAPTELTKDNFSILATALRSIVMTSVCVIVALSKGLHHRLGLVSGKSMNYIFLSGIAGAAAVTIILSNGA